MISTLWPSWLPRRPVVADQPGVTVRPTLEHLERRETPNNMMGSTPFMSVTVTNQSYDLLFQHETVSVSLTGADSQGNLTGIPGAVTVQDGFQQQAIVLDGAGQGKANFAFPMFGNPLFSNPHGDHVVTASYGGSPFLWFPAFASAPAPSTNLQFLLTLYVDFLVLTGTNPGTQPA
jgi:hypothetical protein